MKDGFDIPGFLYALDRFCPDYQPSVRVLALYSAAIAVADERMLKRVVEVGDKWGLERNQYYEIVLQSYLFVGFPRMLIAAENLDKSFPSVSKPVEPKPITTDESTDWFNNGNELCRDVYTDSFEALKNRVSAIAPEVFRWMIVEGYGKVLSRPGLSSVIRELAIVSCLIVENHEKQLFSHMRGALNVGAGRSLLKAVIEDIGPVAEAGYETARTIMKKLERN